MISLFNLGYQIDDQIILDGVELQFQQGETFVIMGPSGCGKSTLLRLIMGLIQPTSGWIEIDGHNTLLFSKERWFQERHNIGMVFQSAALFDSLNVFENVAFGLRRNKLAEAEVNERVSTTLSMVGLEDSVGLKKPADLSGGMKKRTAIARAIAIQPQIVLYDEPTTGLDPIIADTINDLIRDLQSKLGITSIVVTHDISSALKIADRVGLLDEGRLVEIKKRGELNQASHPMLKRFLRNYQLNV